MAPPHVYIVSATRSPCGRFLGQYSHYEAHSLMGRVITSSMAKTPVKSQDIDGVILGQIFTAGVGQNPARQAVLESNLMITTPAHAINMGEASGLKAVQSAYISIVSKENSIVICGGQDSASRARHVMDSTVDDELCSGEIVDTIYCDTGIGHYTDMTADNWAACFNIKPVRLDGFAYRSYIKARQSGDFQNFKNELVPVFKNHAGRDEIINRRPDILTAMPVEDEETGFMIPGNSSPLCDGASMLILCSESALREQQIEPLVRIVAIIEVAVEIGDIVMATTATLRRLMDKVRWTVKEVDLYEIDESYAAQVLVTIAEFKINPCKINACGGGLSMGQPGGAAAARILVTLVHALCRGNLKRGVAISASRDGIGMGIAIERKI